MTNVVKICTNQSMIAWLGDPQGGVNNIAPLKKKGFSFPHATMKNEHVSARYSFETTPLATMSC